MQKMVACHVDCISTAFYELMGPYATFSGSKYKQMWAPVCLRYSKPLWCVTSYNLKLIFTYKWDQHKWYGLGVANIIFYKNCVQTSGSALFCHALYLIAFVFDQVIKGIVEAIILHTEFNNACISTTNSDFHIACKFGNMYSVRR